MTSALDSVRTALQGDTDESLWKLVQNDEASFWVDWKECDDDIVRYCESVLRTGHLRAEWTDAGEMFISFRSTRVRVPLLKDAADRHITIHTLNQLLAPDYEIRYVCVSDGADSAAFVPLRSAEWKQLEEEFPQQVAYRFLPIQESPNLFTEEVLIPKAPTGNSSGRGTPRLDRQERPWWRFL
jgi:hypothetical protein